MKKVKYNSDKRFGDISEKRFNNFYDNFLKEKNKEFFFIETEYTETIEQSIKKIYNQIYINYNPLYNITDIKEIVNRKIEKNIKKLKDIVKDDNFFNRIYNIDLIKAIEKKHYNNIDNKTKRTQTMGIDLIVVYMDEDNNIEDIEFLEVKRFKRKNFMYEKLGVEFFSDYHTKNIGYTFSMICDKVVYAQDVDKGIINTWSKERDERLDEIDFLRENNKNCDVTTYFNIFDNFKFTKTALKHCNNLKGGFYVVKAKTDNKNLSNFVLIDYKDFDNNLVEQKNIKYKNMEVI